MAKRTISGLRSNLLILRVTMSAQAPPRNPLLVALADALAGALGSVVAVIAFYPIDIAKTRAQAKYGECVSVASILRSLGPL